MKSDLPDGLRPDVRNAAQLLIDAARQEGWEIGPVRLQAGVISLSASRSDGSGFQFSCNSDDFPQRLKRALLKEKNL